MKRKLAGMAVLFVFVLIGISWNFLLKDNRISQETYEQIHLGMAIDDVEKIIEMKGGDVDQQANELNNEMKSWILPTRELADMQSEGDWDAKPDDNKLRKRIGWSGSNGVIMIRIDRDGQVTDRMFIKLKPLGLVDQLRWIVATRI